MLKGFSKPAFSLPIETLVKELKTNTKFGLSSAEVVQRQQQFGKNKPKQHKERSVALIFLEQFLDPVIYMLIAAAGLGFTFSEYVEAIAVLVVILITVVIGFFMEWQAVRSMEALRKMTISHAMVLRDGELRRVESQELVPGDIIHLESGDVVPADARIIFNESIALKESALTGESIQVEKTLDPLSEDTPLADRVNMLFTGTLVNRGAARAVVTETGEQTELGKIARLTLEASDESTPIEKKLTALSKMLIWLTLILAALIAISGYLQGRELKQMIETAIALAVASIPEGLPIVATIALARGMLRLAKDRVIIKELSSVETLGSTGVICTDKTGTLTENQMAARSIFLTEENIEIKDDKEKSILETIKDKDAFQKLIQIGVLCNNVKLKKGRQKIGGDPVEIALVDLALKAGIDVKQIRTKYPEVHELPFDSETKMMATLNGSDNHYLVSVKGALESILEKSDKLYFEGNELPFENKAEWIVKAEKMANKGYRTLAFAYRKSSEIIPVQELVHELIFIGLVGFIDPPREDVKEAIRTCHEAGIRVVMVTGDHPGTAMTIAKAVGLSQVDQVEEKVLTGKELDELVKEPISLRNKALETSVFARVTPSQKLEIVKLFQKQNYVVGMTGDGVNDAPALKKADIGIAMGIRGTEAAKDVADVILRDDQFTSIELAIRQGRVIFENIRNFVVYLLSCNLAEIIAVALASLSNLPLPLLPLQILYLNLVTDVFPALALGLGEGQKDIMKYPPRSLDEPIMHRKLWVTTFTYGIGITTGVLGITVFAHFYLHLKPDAVNNMAFYTLVLAQLLNVFNIPKRHASIFKNEVTTNKWVWGAIALSVLLTSLGYIIPPLREALSLVYLPAENFIWIVFFSLVSLVISQLFKKLGLAV